MSRHESNCRPSRPVTLVKSMFGLRILSRVVMALVWSVPMLGLGLGCGGGQSVEPDVASTVPERYRYGTLPYDRVRIEGVDMNGDGQADQFYAHDRDTGTLLWVERDLDFNGHVDLFEYFDPDGEIVEREFLLMHDREVTAVHFFREGVLDRKELATGIVGSAPIVQFFDADGVLRRVERDSTYDGRVDVWEYYEEGLLVRVARDRTGDGEPDTFDITRRPGQRGAP